jgi:hypothetical protein
MRAKTSAEVSLQKAAQAKLRLDGMQFELRLLQPRISPGIAGVVVVDSALRRRYPISCTLQVGQGELSRLSSRAFPPRSLRRSLREDA